MLYAPITYHERPERDEDELYEAHRDAERGAAAEGCSSAGQPPSERRDAGPDGGVHGCISPAAVRSSAGGRS